MVSTASIWQKNSRRLLSSRHQCREQFLGRFSGALPARLAPSFHILAQRVHKGQVVAFFLSKNDICALPVRSVLNQ